MSARAARFIKFNGVGALGILVQLGVVHVLLTSTHADSAIATAIGVSAAVIHNFVWHRLWTWADRAEHSSVLVALARFAAANGIVSFAGGVAIVAVLTRATPLGGVAANTIAIVVCGLVNYVLADRVVFVAGAPTAPTLSRVTFFSRTSDLTRHP